jgi:Ca2+-binding RTX toxin-like protein
MRSFTSALAVCLILAVPAGASAATLGVESDDRLVYRAATGEVNDLTVGSNETGSALEFRESTAPVTLGATCEFLAVITCERRGTWVYLGDRDDRADQYTTNASSRIWGEGGSDTIRSSGLSGIAYGGPGDDRVQIGGNGEAMAWGGPGDDELGGGTHGYTEVYGEKGSDVISGYGGSSVKLDGGGGNDTIVGQSFLGHALMWGGSGRDVLVGEDYESAWNIDSGPGHDTITVTDGADEFPIPDTVVCGSGTDVVNADADDIVSADCEDVRVGASATASAARAGTLRRAERLLRGARRLIPQS